MSPEAKDILTKVMNVLKEYHVDCDNDIEGCTGEELTEIDHCMEACGEIRKRIIAHIYEDADARGQPQSK